MLYLSAQSQFLPFILYLYIIGIFMLGTGAFLFFKSSAVILFFLKNNFNYNKLTPEQKKLVKLPKWHYNIVRGFGVMLAVFGLTIIIATTATTATTAI